MYNHGLSLLYRFASFCVVLLRCVVCCAAFVCIMLYWFVMVRAVLDCVILCCVALCCIVLSCVRVYCIVSYCATL